MKILLFGKNGQVGWALQRSLSMLGTIEALDSKATHLCGDLSNLEGLRRTIQLVKPDLIVNAAAYTCRR
jgi:dTDP-4-dehydrorhamnose reductase